MNKFIVFGLCLSLLIIVGCSQPSVDDSIYRGDPQNDTKVIMEEYNKYQNTESMSEEAYNLKKQIALSDGALKTYLQKLLEHADMGSKYLAELDNSCPQKTDTKICSSIKEAAVNNFAAPSKIEVKEMNFKQINNTSVEWEVIRRDITGSDAQFSVNRYIFNLSGKEWKITDLIWSDGTQLSAALNAELSSVAGSIAGLKSFITDTSSFIDRSANDKCAGIEYDNALTYSEKQEQKDLCYTSKYLDASKINKNTLLCEDIVDESYLGQCYGEVAIATKDVTVCDNAPVKEYTAKGYYQPLNSRDVCYSKLAFEEIFSFTQRKEACNKMLNEQIKSKCLEIVG